MNNEFLKLSLKNNTNSIEEIIKEVEKVENRNRIGGSKLEKENLGYLKEKFPIIKRNKF